MSKTDARRLLTLLDHERAALQRADLPRLERLMPRKTALLARIEAAGVTESPLLTRVRDAASHNARLFEALIAGLRDARALIGSVRDGVRGKTYGRNGARALLDPPQGSLQRRA